jgi:hypothetical protein
MSTKFDGFNLQKATLEAEKGIKGKLRKAGLSHLKYNIVKVGPSHKVEIDGGTEEERAKAAKVLGIK